MRPAPGPARGLVLVRHGRTGWNHTHRIQGQDGEGLDDVGRAQARALAPVIAAMQPVALWSSDLERTRETTAAVVAATGLAPVFDARLREFGFGDLEGLTHDEVRTGVADGPALMTALLAGDYDAVPQVERTADVRARMTAALRELLASVAPGRTGVAVAHGGCLRVAVAALVGWADDAYAGFGHLENCGWVRLAEVGGRVRLLAYNRVAEPSSD